MESNFFRLLARELGPLLVGARIRKVYGPAPDTLVFTLEKDGKRSLLLRFGPTDSLLFLCPDKPSNPPEPEARIMWLRKRLSNRRLGPAIVDWPGRAMAFIVEGGEPAFLLLDLRRGASLVSSLEPDFGRDPGWPSFEELLANDDVWRAYPHCSPALRRHLKGLSPEAAGSFYARLIAGECHTAFLHSKDGKASDLFVWDADGRSSSAALVRVFPSALEAAAAFGQRLLFPELRRAAESEDEERRKAEVKRVRKILKKIESDEARVQELIDQRAKGAALQAMLYAFKPGDKAARAVGRDSEGCEVVLELDPRLTVTGNMERFFRLAAKGERGLLALAARREILVRELAGLEAGRIPAPRPVAPAEKSGRGQGRGASPAKGKPGGDKTSPYARFRSSDGFLILRGKNAAANTRLTQQASAFDLWFHAEDGPGAHCILRRDYPDQEVPRQSVLEAAILAGLKSWQAEAGKARVICALAKNVRSFKGAALGQVRVDAVLETLYVDLDDALEERLRADAS